MRDLVARLRGALAMRNAAVVWLLMTAATGAQERIHLASAESSATVSGTVTGYEGKQYVVAARAGQTLSIDFHASRPMLSFNVLKDGVALHEGSIEPDEQWTGTLPVAGDYVIDVYFPSTEAQRGTSARYELTAMISEGTVLAKLAVRTVRYHCADGSEIRVTYGVGDPGSAIVVAHSNTYRMRPIQSGSGAKYTDGIAIWWNKGSAGTFEVAGVQTECWD